MKEFHTFADTVLGLTVAFELTEGLRQHGFKTRLATRKVAGFTVHTVIATPPVKLTRAERGCNLGAH